MAAKNRYKIAFETIVTFSMLSQKLLVVTNLTMLSAHCAIPFGQRFLKAFEVEEAQVAEA